MSYTVNLSVGAGPVRFERDLYRTRYGNSIAVTIRSLISVDRIYSLYAL